MADHATPDFGKDKGRVELLVAVSAAIDRVQAEWDLTMVDIVGVLHMVALDRQLQQRDAARGR